MPRSLPSTAIVAVGAVMVYRTRLEPVKSAAEFIVIDHIGKLTAN
jgi:hypothetical protein